MPHPITIGNDNATSDNKDDNIDDAPVVKVGSETQTSSPRHVHHHHHFPTLTSPKPDCFGELLQRLASCHEQHVVEKEEMRSQVQELTREVTALRNILSKTECKLQECCPNALPRKLIRGFTHLSLPSHISYETQADHTLAMEIQQTDSRDLPKEPHRRWAVLARRLLDAGNADRNSFEEGQARYRLLAHWRGAVLADAPPLFMAFGQLINIEGSRKTGTMSTVQTDSADTARDLLQCMVVSPASWKRLLWVLVGVIFLTWDALVIPLQLFPLGRFSSTIGTVAMFSTSYWVVDMPTQCFIAYQNSDGTLENRPRFIALHYLTTWFSLDLLVLAVDLVLFGLDLDNQMTNDVNNDSAILQAGRTLGLARLMRLLRVVRLFRLRKLSEFLGLAISRIKSEHMVLGIKLARHVAMILLVNHYIACAWYFIATFHENEPSWLDSFAGKGASTPVLYVMALHWSMTQFSPATNNIAPENSAERLFAVCVVLFALIMFSSFISSVTNTVNELRRMNEDTQREELRIREFLFARRVSADLVGRILNFFKQNYRGRQKRIHEEDIPFFQDVPESMKIRLHEEAYMPVLTASPMFCRFLDLGGSLQVQVCHTAFSELFYLPQQDVFVAGTPSSGSYFVRSGHLFYHSIVGEEEDYEKEEVAPEDWIAEMTLVVEWNHCGQLIAQTSSELVKLDKTQFNSIISKAGGPFVECLKRYASFVLGHIESLPLNEPVTDLSLDLQLLLDLATKARRLWDLESRTSKRNWSSISDYSSNHTRTGSQLTMATETSPWDSPRTP